jgi:hypothetical protein
MGSQLTLETLFSLAIHYFFLYIRPKKEGKKMGVPAITGAPVAGHPPLTFCDRLTRIVSMVALAILYAVSVWSCPYLFTSCLIAGVFLNKEVKERIWDVFDRMSWKWVVPSGIVLFMISLPATLTATALLAGLDAGARLFLMSRRA